MLEQKLMDKGEELWEAFCQPAPVELFPEKSISYKQVQSEVPAAKPPGIFLFVKFYASYFFNFVTQYFEQAGISICSIFWKSSKRIYF